jgi:hypothetical protein
MKKAGFPSPDRADTLMMVTAPDDSWVDSYRDPSGAEEIVGRTPKGHETITGDLLNIPM